MSKRMPELIVGGEPRVDLLPPEIRAARRTAGIRRVMTIVLVGLVLVVVAATAGTSLLAGIAKDQLVAEQGVTTDLFGQQQEFIEVRQDSQLIATIEAAMRVGSSTLVDWQTLSNEITAALPENTSVASLTLDAATPLKGAVQAVSPLAKARIATMVFTVYTPSLLESEVWVRSIAPVPGVADVEAQTVQHRDSPDGYLTTIAVSIDATRLMNPLGAGANE